jgi:hypothetical protein
MFFVGGMRGGPLQSEAAVKLRFKGLWLRFPAFRVVTSFYNFLIFHTAG